MWARSHTHTPGPSGGHWGVLSQNPPSPQALLSALDHRGLEGWGYRSQLPSPAPSEGPREPRLRPLAGRGRGATGLGAQSENGAGDPGRAHLAPAPAAAAAPARAAGPGAAGGWRGAAAAGGGRGRRNPCSKPASGRRAARPARSRTSFPGRGGEDAVLRSGEEELHPTRQPHPIPTALAAAVASLRQSDPTCRLSAQEPAGLQAPAGDPTLRQGAGPGTPGAGRWGTQCPANVPKGKHLPGPGCGDPALPGPMDTHQERQLPDAGPREVVEQPGSGTRLLWDSRGASTRAGLWGGAPPLGGNYLVDAHPSQGQSQDDGRSVFPLVLKGCPRQRWEPWAWGRGPRDKQASQAPPTAALTPEAGPPHLPLALSLTHSPLTSPLLTLTPPAEGHSRLRPSHSLSAPVWGRVRLRHGREPLGGLQRPAQGVRVPAGARAAPRRRQPRCTGTTSDLCSAWGRGQSWGPVPPVPGPVSWPPHGPHPRQGHPEAACAPVSPLAPGVTLRSRKRWTGTSSRRQASRMKRSRASLGLRPRCSRCRAGTCRSR